MTRLATDPATQSDAQSARCNPLARWTPSPNFDARQAPIAYIVVHHTQCSTLAHALLDLETHNAQGRVSAHYLIDRDGTIYQLVVESDRAWHAGVGRWADLDDLNSRSIGIELVNDGDEPFEDALIESLIRLLDDIVSRIGIDRRNIIGHADLAPTRKVDPSAWFPWDRLARHGFGLWPDAPLRPAPADFDADAAMRAIGYDLADRPAAVAAFLRHFTGRAATQLTTADLDLLHTLSSQLQGAPP